MPEIVTLEFRGDIAQGIARTRIEWWKPEPWKIEETVPNKNIEAEKLGRCLQDC